MVRVIGHICAVILWGSLPFVILEVLDSFDAFFGLAGIPENPYACAGMLVAFCLLGYGFGEEMNVHPLAIYFAIVSILTAGFGSGFAFDLLVSAFRASFAVEFAPYTMLGIMPLLFLYLWSSISEGKDQPDSGGESWIGRIFAGTQWRVRGKFSVPGVELEIESKSEEDKGNNILRIEK